MTHQEIFDLIVIGARGGGYSAAFRLANADKRVLLIDSLGNLGGNCLYEGCVPSKAVRQATIMVYNSTQANFLELRALVLQGIGQPFGTLKTVSNPGVTANIG